MDIAQDISLRAYNTFGVDVSAKYFATFTTVDECKELLQSTYAADRHLVLGGGSNVLFTKNFDGLVLKNELKGIKVVHEDEDHYYIQAAAGEVWHQLVMHCVDNNYAGLENLALIPGCAGAAPMQNIGAYGVEMKDVFDELEALHIATGEIHTFKKDDCAFGYRESVFKQKHKGEYVILSVTFKLNKEPNFNIKYGAIEEELEKMGIGIKALNIKAIAQAVTNIRRSKLPDPAEIGNAGSFFKNPVIETKQFAPLKKRFPQMSAYKLDDDHMKLAAGWLIEKCGWKGFRKDDYGVHAKQALVLVNYGQATGKQIYNFSGDIMHSVRAKFGVELEREVNII